MMLPVKVNLKLQLTKMHCACASHSSPWKRNTVFVQAQNPIQSSAGSKIHEDPESYAFQSQSHPDNHDNLLFREKFALSYSYCAQTSISISYNTKVLFLSHTWLVLGYPVSEHMPWIISCVRRIFTKVLHSVFLGELSRLQKNFETSLIKDV